MPHTLIIGMTESGKTTLAKQLCHNYRNREIKTVVLDPLSDPGWQADYQTTEAILFLEMVKRSRSCALFIDESGETIGRYNDEMFWLATRSRHYGHNAHFLCQRYVQLNPTVRDQCAHLFVFACSIKDGKALSDDWNRPELEGVNVLKQFECFYVTRFGECAKLTITLDTE